jgi:hypothetical protein
MWVLLLSIAYVAGGGAMVSAEFANKDLCVQAASAFTTTQGQVRWLCAPKQASQTGGNTPAGGGS